MTATTTASPEAVPGSDAKRFVVLAISEPYGDDGAISQALASRLATSPAGARMNVIAMGAHPAAVVANWHQAMTAVIVRQSHLGLFGLGAIKHVELDTSLRDVELMAGGHVGEAIALGRAVGRLPRRLVLLSVECGNVAPGTDLAPELDDAVDRAVAEIVALVERSGPTASH